MNKSEEISSSNQVKDLVKLILDEMTISQQKQAEPSYKRELSEEKAKREALEYKLNEVIEENKRSKQMAQVLDRESRIKTELSKQGVTKLDLAYKAVKDEVLHEQDGTLTGKGPQGTIPLRDFLKDFLDENPELLPARNTTGSGAAIVGKTKSTMASIDLDAIHPGMSKDEMARARQEIARIANQITT